MQSESCDGWGQTVIYIDKVCELLFVFDVHSQEMTPYNRAVYRSINQMEITTIVILTFLFGKVASEMNTIPHKLYQ